MDPRYSMFLDASDELGYRDAARRRAAVSKLYRETVPSREDANVLRYLDDLMRVLADKASFGAADNVEGLANSQIYDAPFDDSHAISRHRTEQAGERLGPWGRPVAETAGTLGGYAATLPLLPLRAISALRGMLTPAAPALEATRGYLSTPGGVGERGRGALSALASQPFAAINPMTGPGLAAMMGYQPATEHLGVSHLTPEAYLARLLGE